jgi:hypothetical protein
MRVLAGGRMARQSLLLIGLGMSLVLCVGCAELDPGPSLVAMDYGNSFNLAKQNQILNPGAQDNLDPVAGFDGRAAQKTINRYQKDFEKPTPPPKYVLSVGDLVK